MKKVMFIISNGTYIVGYTEHLILEKIPENNHVMEVEDEILNAYMRYKIVDGALVHMDDAEYDELYPIAISEPTEQEQINAMLMLEIAKLKAKEGGVDENA